MPNYKCLFVFVTILIFSLLRRSNALKCFTCTTESYEGCKDPFDINQYTFETECSDPDHVCMKHENAQSYFVTELLKRGCVSENYCEEERNPVHCSTCKSDHCNSSTRINASFIFIYIGVLMLFTNYF